MGTGRSDYPNQINNVLAFPGLFRGALDVRAKKINEEMTLKYNYGFSSAMAWVYFAITIVLIGVSALMLKGVVSSDE